MTFLIPFDLPAGADKTKTGRPKDSARKRWDRAVDNWRQEIPGASQFSILLRTSGDLLEALARPGNEGRRWFFFEQLALSPLWFAEKLADAKMLAGPRYTPASHVRLPIEEDLDALAATPQFLRAVEHLISREAARSASLAVTARRLSDSAGTEESSFAEIGSLQVLQASAAAASLSFDQASAALGAFGPISPSSAIPSSRLTEICGDLRAAILTFIAAVRGQRESLPRGSLSEGAAEHGNEMVSADRLASVAVELGRAQTGVFELEQAAAQPALRAAEHARLLVVGDAGQGKTHLFLDAATRAAVEGRPALCVLGEQLHRGDVLTQIAVLCGLGPLSHDTFLGALDAAGEMAGSRMLLLIDAVNDSEAPETWVSALPELVAATRRYRHVAIAFSCRSVFARHILPTDEALHDLKVPVRQHRGFAGFEVEALEAYLTDAPQYVARTPLLRPDFSNPLFVKIYSEVVRDDGKAGAWLSPHRSAVFERFLAQRCMRATRRLRLDPDEHRVEDAMNAFARELARRADNAMPRAEAVALVNAFAPDRTQWPNTMFGVLRSEGALADDRWLSVDGQVVQGVGFPYQALGDFRICRQVFDDCADEVAALRDGAGLPSDGRLRPWLTQAGVNLLEAATVLLPETAGVELVDVLGKDANRRRLMLSYVAMTLAMRRSDAVTERTMELLQEAESAGRGHEVWDGIMAVAAEPGHRLNADWLHRNLLAWPRAERDAWWVQRTFYASTTDDDAALPRLLRWAERTPTPAHLLPDGPVTSERRAEAPEEVVRLAATTLTWLLASSNRFVRDRATKALVQLLLGYSDVLLGLIDRFIGQDRAVIDDPYITQRLLHVAYGVVMRVGHVAPESVTALAERMLNLVLDPAADDQPSPDAAGRDAAAGVVEYAVYHGFLNADALDRALPPYRSSQPTQPPTQTELLDRYPRQAEDDSRPYSALYFSLDQGDFARYVVQPVMSNITRAAEIAPPPLDQGDTLVRWACRWIFERVVQLGWTSELFGEFERRVRDHDSGRSAHKPERISKKYQWISLHELTARLTDYSQLEPGWDGSPRRYQGAWQLGVRDIDPSLPPAPHPRDHDEWSVLRLADQEPGTREATFRLDLATAFWMPPAPTLPSRDEVDGWLAKEDDLPDLPGRLIVEDADGTRWICLVQYSTYIRREEDQDRPFDETGAQQWHHINAWLTPTQQSADLAAFLNERSLMGNWMPDNTPFTEAYFGEAPWHRAWQAEDATGRLEPLMLNEYAASDPDDAVAAGWTRQAATDCLGSPLLLAPAARHFTWDAGSRDCSLESSVSVQVPATMLLHGAGVVRHPDLPDWYRNNQLVATSRLLQGDDPSISALLVRESWLIDRLKELDLGLVSAMLAERMVLHSQPTSWRVIEQTGYVVNGQWTFGAVRSEVNSAGS